MNWSFYLAAYSAGEWLITSIVMAAIYPALEAWFVKNRVIQAHEVLIKFDKDIVLGETKIPDPKDEKKAKKADGFDDDWE